MYRKFIFIPIFLFQHFEIVHLYMQKQMQQHNVQFHEEMQIHHWEKIKTLKASLSITKLQMQMQMQKQMQWHLHLVTSGVVKIIGKKYFSTVKMHSKYSQNAIVWKNMGSPELGSLKLVRKKDKKKILIVKTQSKQRSASKSHLELSGRLRGGLLLMKRLKLMKTPFQSMLWWIWWGTKTKLSATKTKCFCCDFCNVLTFEPLVPS